MIRDIEFRKLTFAFVHHFILPPFLFHKEIFERKDKLLHIASRLNSNLLPILQ